MFRISKDSNTIIDVARIDEIEPAIRANPPGRYDIYKIGLRPLSSGRTRRPWGIAFKRQDGSVLIKPDSWYDEDGVRPGSPAD